MKLSETKKAYIAGFLDGDGSIYVRAKPNSSYKYGYQIAPSIILFQSSKDKTKFEELTSMIGLGYTRERKDGILEYTINREDNIITFLNIVRPYSILKKKQIVLMLKILKAKKKVKTDKDFRNLVDLVDSYRDLNYSKKRKRVIMPVETKR